MSRSGEPTGPHVGRYLETDTKVLYDRRTAPHTVSPADALPAARSACHERSRQRRAEMH